MSKAIGPLKNISARDVQHFFQVYQPSWETHIALGTLDGAVSQNFTTAIYGLTNGDGECHYWPIPEPFTDLDPAGETVYVVSDDNADAGQLMLIVGVDAAGDQLTDVVISTGTTPVASNVPFRHVNGLLVVTAEASNAGQYYVSTKATAGTPDAAADHIQIVMPPNQGLSSAPKIRVPNGVVFVYPRFVFTSDRNDGIEARVYTTSPNAGRFEVGHFFIYASQFEALQTVPFVVTAGETIEFTVQRSDSGAGSVNSAAFINFYSLSANDVDQQTNEIIDGAKFLFNEED